MADVEVNPKTSPWKDAGNASYALSIKNLESFRLARKYADRGEQFIQITTVPQTVYEEYDIIYMSQYESLLVGESKWNIWNPFRRNPKKSEVDKVWPKNITL